jgi:homoserine dehydrogenase
MAPPETIGIALVGCGTVGRAVVRLLVRDNELLTRRAGVRPVLRHVVDVDHTRARQAGADPSIFRKNLDEVLKDKDTAIVVELVGGTKIARKFVEQTLRAGKHVVTANKALLAHHGNELWALARANNVCIAFEGSCVGGVPVIGVLLQGLLANDIEAMYGIVNGTCNYILSNMSAHGARYADVLLQAQQAGLAEADPSLDVCGTDSAHKIAILGALAFGQRIDFDRIHVEGIDTLDVADIRFGKELGYTVKLLAIAERLAEGVSLRVHPAFIPASHPLAPVSGAFNALSIFAHATGHTLYYGRGAGGMPTASAVVSDILSIALDIAPRQFRQLGIWPDRAQPAVQLPIEQIRSRYYLRITAEDRPGVLGSIADVLGRHEISIASVLQHESALPAGEGVPVIITTYEAVEGNIAGARAEIDALESVRAPTVVIRIVMEHEEPVV